MPTWNNVPRDSDGRFTSRSSGKRGRFCCLVLLRILLGMPAILLCFGISVGFAGEALMGDFAALDKACATNYRIVKQINELKAELQSNERMLAAARRGENTRTMLTQGEFESQAEYRARQQKAEQSDRERRKEMQQKMDVLPGMAQVQQEEIARLERLLIPSAVVRLEAPARGTIPRFDQSTMTFPGWEVPFSCNFTHITLNEDRIETVFKFEEMLDYSSVTFDNLEEAKYVKNAFEAGDLRAIVEFSCDLRNWESPVLVRAAYTEGTPAWLRLAGAALVGLTAVATGNSEAAASYADNMQYAPPARSVPDEYAAGMRVTADVYDGPGAVGVRMWISD